MDYQKLVDFFAGSDEFTMQHRIFNTAISFSIVTMVPAVFLLAFLQQWMLCLVMLINIGLYSYINLLCRVKDELQKAVLLFTIVGTTLLNVMWMADRGPLGGGAYFMFVLIVLLMFTAEKPIRYVAALFFNGLVMSILYDPLLPYFPWQMPFSYFGQVASFLTVIVFMGFICWLYRQEMRTRSSEALSEVVDQLVTESGGVSQTSDSLAQSSEYLLAAALQQKSATEQLSVTTEELGATAEQNTQLTSSAISSIKESEQSVTESQEKIEDLQRSIHKIKESSEEIQNITNLINDIAYQTNILSLNAMIEASRSSEGSGGFKVVAMEVKKLAERCASAAEGINKILVTNLKSVEEGVEDSEEMREKFDEIAARTKPFGRYDPECF